MVPIAVFAWCCAIANADRDSHKGGGMKNSFSVHRDGHFQLATERDEAAPEPSQAGQTVSPGGEARKIKALLPDEPKNLSGNGVKTTDPKILAVQQGGWFHQPEKPRWKPLGSSFVNRTEDWMTLSHVASGSLASTRLQSNDEEGMKTPQPTVPPERYKSQPKSWPSKAWDEYQRAYEKLAPLRGGVGNTIATVAAVFLGPDSCILKILYVFFSMDGEDDYPYIPRGCGDMFDFALNANSIPVPWMLIAGALFIVTGTHSSANSLN